MKENCMKYGNPDGMTSFKVGIGLPSIMIDAQHQYLVLPVILLILLFAVPKVFLVWNGKLKMKDESGMEIKTYSNIFPCFTPKMNTISCCLVMGAMCDLKVP